MTKKIMSIALIAAVGFSPAISFAEAYDGKSIEVRSTEGEWQSPPAGNVDTRQSNELQEGQLVPFTDKQELAVSVAASIDSIRPQLEAMKKALSERKEELEQREKLNALEKAQLADFKEILSAIDKSSDEELLRQKIFEHLKSALSVMDNNNSLPLAVAVNLLGLELGLVGPVKWIPGMNTIGVGVEVSFNAVLYIVIENGVPVAKTDFLAMTSAGGLSTSGDDTFMFKLMAPLGGIRGFFTDILWKDQTTIYTIEDLLGHYGEATKRAFDTPVGTPHAYLAAKYDTNEFNIKPSVVIGGLSFGWGQQKSFTAVGARWLYVHKLSDWLKMAGSIID